MKKEIRCDLCNNEIKEFLDLGNQPLANKYPKKEEFKDEDYFPLKVLFCESCKNVQLGHKVSRNLMFEEYFYLSSVNKGLVRYFEGLAEQLKDSEFLLDIGSNDGIFLRELKKIGVKCLGVDPADVAKLANKEGLTTIISFFNKDCVNQIIEEYGKPDCITCSSTFTHLENPHQFIKDMKELISEKGKIILEVEYIGNFIKNIQFERFYLDRIFYYSVTSLKSLFEQYDMDIVDVEEIDVHGGALKITIYNSSQNKQLTQRTIDWLKKEENELTVEILTGFKDVVKENIDLFKNKLQEYKDQGLKVAGYGSPARLSCICNYGNIDESLIKFTVDDSPLKCGRFTPGTHIPIVSKEELEKYDPDLIIMFAYEYFEDIKRKLNKPYKFLLPIPPKEIEKELEEDINFGDNITF